MATKEDWKLPLGTLTNDELLMLHTLLVCTMVSSPGARDLHRAIAVIQKTKKRNVHRLLSSVLDKFTAAVVTFQKGLDEEDS